MTRRLMIGAALAIAAWPGAAAQGMWLQATTRHFTALTLFYATFAGAGQKPSASATAGIRRALELVPQDPDVRYTVARQAILDGDPKEARRVLAPLAFDPHAGPDNAAAKLVALLDSGLKGQAALDALEKADKPAAAAAATTPAS